MEASGSAPFVSREPAGADGGMSFRVAGIAIAGMLWLADRLQLRWQQAGPCTKSEASSTHLVNGLVWQQLSQTFGHFSYFWDLEPTVAA